MEVRPLSARAAELARLLVDPGEMARRGATKPTLAEMAEALRDIAREIKGIESRAADAEAALARADKMLAARAAYSGILERQLGIGPGCDLGAPTTVARIEDARRARRTKVAKRLDALFSPHPFGPDAA